MSWQPDYDLDAEGVNGLEDETLEAEVETDATIQATRKDVQNWFAEMIVCAQFADMHPDKINAVSDHFHAFDHGETQP